MAERELNLYRSRMEANPKVNVLEEEEDPEDAKGQKITAKTPPIDSEGEEAD